MRPIAKRYWTAGVLLILVPVVLSGCIVCVDDIFCDNRPPQMATLHVYALDYYTGMPITWAHVEVSESDWWSWDYIGTWPVGPSGYANIRCGYLYPDGCGGHEEEDYRVVVTQGLSLYGILKQKGVEARLVYYPDEGHWIEKPKNSIHWYGEFLSWLDRYIGAGSHG